MAGKKILIVDDSATERYFFMETLSKQGYECITAENGDEAIQKSRSEQPDVILMDIVMPGIDGYKATRTIANDQATRHIPVIICTSRNQETDRVWGRTRSSSSARPASLPTRSCRTRARSTPRRRARKTRARTCSPGRSSWKARSPATCWKCACSTSSSACLTE